MVLKIVAIVTMVAAGIYFIQGSRARFTPVLDRPFSFDLLTAMGAALVPTLFAYGGWQTSSFLSGELRRPERDLPPALLLGTVGGAGRHFAVNVICLRSP